MPSVRSTDRPVLWAVGDPIVASGVLEEPGVLLTGLTLIYNTDENAYLLALADVSAPPMPDVGVEIVANTIYDYNGTLYMVRATHIRTGHDPATTPNLFFTYQEDAGEAPGWIANEWVNAGTRRVYGGVLYYALQAHQTLVTTYPPAPGILGLLWGVVALTPEWAIGVTYQGDNQLGAGNGNVVTHQGGTYRCLQGHTSIASWSPTSPGILGVLWAVHE